MPLYEYECEACGHRFEVIQKFSDAPIAACPTCGGGVQKLLSSPAIQFKGSGFYLTDYGRGTASKPEGGAAKTGKPDSGSSSGETASADGAKSDTTSTAAKAATGDTTAAKPSAAKSD